jgi:hypothetical protein
MRMNDGSPRHGVETSPPMKDTTKDTPKDASAEAVHGAALLAPTAVALGASGMVLAVAIAWGAAEAAVAVAAGYLVYNAIMAKGDLSGMLGVRLLAGAFRRPPATPKPGGPRVD